MNIIYKETKIFNEHEVKELFQSVKWSSANYPKELTAALGNSSCVVAAYDGEKLIGLINVLDDGVMTAYIHYLLVNPKYQGTGVGKKLLEIVKTKYSSYLRIVLNAYNERVGFYEKTGFSKSTDATPMYITKLDD